VFPKKKGVPQNGWFIIKNIIKMDGLEFGGSPIFVSIYIWTFVDFKITITKHEYIDKIYCLMIHPITLQIQWSGEAWRRFEKSLRTSTVLELKCPPPF